MPYLAVLCRRFAPSPPGGWPHSDGGLRFSSTSYESWHGILTGGLDGAIVEVIEVQATDDAADRMNLMCRALADASHGIVVRPQIMVIEPRYSQSYQGSPADLRWDQLEDYGVAKAGREAAQQRTEREQAQVQWRINMSQETDKHVLYTELLRVLLASRSDPALLARMESERWVDETSVEELHRLLREHGS